MDVSFGRMGEVINISIVEDNDTIRSGILEFINDTEDFRCVSEHPDCESLLEILPSINPDIILLDIDLPGISGIDGITEIRKIRNGQKIIIITIHAESENLFEAILAGAHGYLEKKTRPYQMLNYLREVNAGRSIMNTYIARKIINYFLRSKTSEKSLTKKLNNVERTILSDLTNGLSAQAIANQFEVPVESVSSGFFNIYEKIHLEVMNCNSSLKK